MIFRKMYSCEGFGFENISKKQIIFVAFFTTMQYYISIR